MEGFFPPLVFILHEDWEFLFEIVIFDASKFYVCKKKNDGIQHHL